jgi:hypothetical protein
MLCSRCSEPVKPVVAIDIDGTLGDYHTHFIDFASNWLGLGLEGLLKASLNMYSGEKAFSVYCCELFDIQIGTYRDIKLAYRQGGMKRSMPILDGAREICFMVRQSGAELWLTTTRPYLSLDNVVPDTVAWLDRYAIAHDYMIFDEDKYAVLADKVDSRRVVAVLDDLPEMYDAAAEVFGKYVPILARGRFNKKVKRPNSMSLSWTSLEIHTRIRKWKESNVHAPTTAA